MGQRDARCSSGGSDACSASGEGMQTRRDALGPDGEKRILVGGNRWCEMAFHPKSVICDGLVRWPWRQGMTRMRCA